MRINSFDAVIFDMDGVLTKTAAVHAKAWKAAFDEYLRLREKRDKEPFREFTHEHDYLVYVDGKPRYDGVKSFLESRGIEIPFGEPQDPPDKETVCGIGNKKNEKFFEVIQTQGAEVYTSTIAFIKELKQAGVSIGAISSSKNCEYILKIAAIDDLFQTRVDGKVSVELGLKGKPEPDIFVTAAHNLGAVPARSIVVEDAISGVQAGRNGGFGLVIGLARKDNELALLDNGADVAMKDIAEINLRWVEQWFQRKPKPLLQYWPKAEEIQDDTIKAGAGKIFLNPYYTRNPKSAITQDKKPVFFLDYDGTLTPIVDRPELAVLSSEMREVVKRLSEKATLAIVSGRMREEVEKFVGIKGLLYAGSHGFDILGPQLSMIEPRAEKSIPLINQIIEQLLKQLSSIPEVLIEKKKFSTAVHYRLVEEKFLPMIKQEVDKIIKDNPTLRLMSGKKVFEILPAIAWDKGMAVRWIMRARGISWNDARVVYIGDDTTDEDAFRVVRTRGTTILVCEKPKQSAADFQLSSPEEVKKLFEEIITSL
ncbi:trehalose-phosphatase [Candidatus Omnitrophota bacterium]